MVEEEINRQNPQWQGDTRLVNFPHKRNLFEELWSQINNKLMTYLTGPRRSGKSVLLKQIIQDLLINENISPRQILFFQFKIGDPKEKIQEVFDFFWQNITDTRQKLYVFFDEIQYPENYEIIIKQLYDLYEGKAKFFLTGSLSFWYKRKIFENMAGRYLSFRLFPLTFIEYLEIKNLPEIADLRSLKSETNPFIKSQIANKLNPLFKEFLYFGRYPEMLTLSSNSYNLYLDSLTNGALNQDAFAYFDIRKPHELVSLYEYLRVNNGGEINISSLSSKSSFKTISAYLDDLETMGLVYFVYNSINPLIKKNVSRKAYVNSSIYLKDSKLDPTTSIGLAVESYVLERFLEQKLEPITFYRKRLSEIDFLLPKQKIAYEIKFKNYINNLDFIKRFSQKNNFSTNIITLNKAGSENNTNYITAIEL